MMLKKNVASTRGETLAETVIALMILGIGIAFSASIMASSLGNITSAKNRVIAVNIAREGVEGMRNIRDTNWLKFSSNRRLCWNHLPGDPPDECKGNNPIGIGAYMIYKDGNQRWRLGTHEEENPLALKQVDQMTFSRMVEIDYLTNEGLLVSELPEVSLNGEHNRMRITVTVKWIEQNLESSVVLKTHLTDYFGRNHLEN